MEKALDLRIQKTYKALIEAFLRLLKEKRFENITVNEICDAAMVRRATFYKHFGDKYEFFVFMVKHIRNDFHSRKHSVKADAQSADPYVQIVSDTLDFLDENDDLVQSILNSTVFPVLLDLISEQIVQDVKEKFREAEKNGKELLLSANLMAQAYTGALVNIARWWVQHKDQASKEEIVEQITKLIEKLYYGTEET